MRPEHEPTSILRRISAALRAGADRHLAAEQRVVIEAFDGPRAKPAPAAWRGASGQPQRH